MTDDIDEAKLYSLARDKDRNNKSWGIKDGKLILKKERWTPYGTDYKLNKTGYVYIIKTDDYEHSDMSHEYIIKHDVILYKIMKVNIESVKDKIIYLSREEYNRTFNTNSGGSNYFFGTYNDEFTNKKYDDIKVVKKISQGMMGTVYLGKLNGEDLVVKVAKIIPSFMKQKQ